MKLTINQEIFVIGFIRSEVLNNIYFMPYLPWNDIGVTKQVIRLTVTEQLETQVPDFPLPPTLERVGYRLTDDEGNVWHHNWPSLDVTGGPSLFYRFFDSQKLTDDELNTLCSTNVMSARDVPSYLNALSGGIWRRKHDDYSSEPDHLNWTAALESHLQDVIAECADKYGVGIKVEHWNGNEKFPQHTISTIESVIL